MNVQRGDIVTVVFPFSSGSGGKLRPALVVQSDANNDRIANVILAAITTTTHRNDQPTQLLIEIATPTGQSTGLMHDSVVTCENLTTLEQSLLRRKLGKLSPAAMREIDGCLKAALGIV